MKLASTLAVITILLSVTTSAEARKRSSKKDGFVFGASVISSEGVSNLSPNESSNSKRTITSNVSGIAPHLGYSFGTMAIGLRATNKTEDVEHIENDAINTEKKSVYKTTTNTNDLSLYTRVNLGSVIYLEAGFGIYQQKTEINNEHIIEITKDTFTGVKEEYLLDGLGSGHHTAIGFEVPISSGFFFNGALNFKNYEIRKSGSGPAFGDKQSSHNQKDINFGVNFYFN